MQIYACCERERPDLVRARTLRWALSGSLRSCRLAVSLTGDCFVHEAYCDANVTRKQLQVVLTIIKLKSSLALWLANQLNQHFCREHSDGNHDQPWETADRPITSEFTLVSCGE